MGFRVRQIWRERGEGISMYKCIGEYYVQYILPACTSDLLKHRGREGAHIRLLYPFSARVFKAFASQLWPLFPLKGVIYSHSIPSYGDQLLNGRCWYSSIPFCSHIYIYTRIILPFLPSELRCLPKSLFVHEHFFQTVPIFS